MALSILSCRPDWRSTVFFVWSCVVVLHFYLEFQFNLFNGLEIDLQISLDVELDDRSRSPNSRTYENRIHTLLSHFRNVRMDEPNIFGCDFILFLVSFFLSLLHLSSIFPTNRFIVFPGFHLVSLSLFMYLLISSFFYPRVSIVFMCVF